jgi:uncharacterized protein (DUF2062 family)
MRAHIERYAERIRDGLWESFSDAYTPREVAGSFALGVFITMLPTLGTGLIVFVILSALIGRINRVALFASVLVVNPAVKWGVYAASIALGVFLLGPVDGLAESTVSVDEGRELLVRLLVGNLLLAVGAALVGYLVVYQMVLSYRKRDLHVVETVIEEFDDDAESTSTPQPQDQSETRTDAE